MLGRIAFLGAAAALVIAALGLLERVTDLRFHPEGSVPMAPSTAIGFELLAFTMLIALRTAAPGPFGRRSTDLACGLVAVYGFLGFLAWLTGWPINPDDQLFPDVGFQKGYRLDRMSPATGALFLLAGLALIALMRRGIGGSRADAWLSMAGFAGAAIGLTAAVFTLAYLVDAPLLYGGATIPMALPTALGFMFLGASLAVTATLYSSATSRWMRILNALTFSRDPRPSLGFLLVNFLLLGGLAWQQTEQFWQQTVALYEYPLQVRHAVGVLKADLLELELDFGTPVGAGGEEERQGALERSGARGFDILAERYLGPRADVDAARQAFTGWLALHQGDRERPLAGNGAGAPHRLAKVDAIRAQRVLLLARLDKIDAFARHKSEEIYHNARVLRVGLNHQLAVIVATLLGLALLISYGLFAAFTVRKKLEATLAASEKEFRLLAESMPQIVWVTRPDGWNIYFNHQWVDYTGLTLEESYGHGWNKPFHPDDQQRAWDAWQNAVNNNGTYSLECRLCRADGVYRWWLIRGVPVLDESGMICKWFGTCTDIHEIKLAENELRQSQQLLNNIIDSAPSSIFALDLQHRFTLLNDELARFFGMPKEEVLGKTVYDVYSREVADARMATNTQLMATGETLSIEETVASKRLNEPRVVMTTTFPLRDADGKITGLAGVATDITERKRAEAEWAQYQERLEREVAVRTADLTATNIDLEAFGYSVSHDLRAPLRAIDGFVGILREEYAPRLDEEGLRLLTVVSDNARRMGRLIDDFLAFSRASRWKLQRQWLDMNTLVAEVWRDLAAQRGERAIDFRCGELPRAWGDARALRQVWQHLLANAVKFTRDRTPAVIDVSGEVTPEDTRYRVGDNGVGFNPDYAAKLFVLFQRLHGMDEFEGTGVGLAIVKRFVQKHGGRVAAEGVPGASATFHFSLANHPSSLPPAGERGHGVATRRFQGTCEDPATEARA